MSYVPGITKNANAAGGVGYNKKSVEQKKEEAHKKKSTCKLICPLVDVRKAGIGVLLISSSCFPSIVNPFELLNDGED